MTKLPRFVSIIAIALGSFDLIRGILHTVFVEHAASNIAGLALNGPTGRDQIVLMAAFGASNIITGAALIISALTNRLGALILIAIIPAAYVLANTSIEYWGADLSGQGVFPGTQNMRIYVTICIITVIAALVVRWQSSKTLSLQDLQSNDAS